MENFKIINREVAQLTKRGKVVRIWNSQKEASEFTKIPQSNISRCCNGKLKTAGDYRWVFR